MNQRLIGDVSGSMAADFLSILSRVNRTSFEYQSLSAGDQIIVGSSHLEVLWPPKILNDVETLKVVNTAIEDFNNALKEDDALKSIIDRIGERGEMQPYLSDEVGRNRGIDQENIRNLPYLEEIDNLSESIQKANNSLRAAANHLSLAFYEDSKFLFMGDLENYEIEKVVDALLYMRRKHFFITVTPHHGTHWQNKLSHIHTSYAIHSAGPRLFRHISPEYKNISDLCLVTYLNGDVQLPVFVPMWSELFLWQNRHPFL